MTAPDGQPTRLAHVFRSFFREAKLKAIFLIELLGRFWSESQVGASTAIHTYLQVLLGAHIVPEEPLSKKGFVDWGSHALEKCGGLS